MYFSLYEVIPAILVSALLIYLKGITKNISLILVSGYLLFTSYEYIKVDNSIVNRIGLVLALSLFTTLIADTIIPSRSNQNKNEDDDKS